MVGCGVVEEVMVGCGGREGYGGVGCGVVEEVMVGWGVVW